MTRQGSPQTSHGAAQPHHYLLTFTSTFGLKASGKGNVPWTNSERSYMNLGRSSVRTRSFLTASPEPLAVTSSAENLCSPDCWHRAQGRLIPLHVLLPHASTTGKQPEAGTD